MNQGLSLRVMEFLTVFIGQQILYCLENVDINYLYAVSSSADLNTLSQHSSARLFERYDNVFSLIIGETGATCYNFHSKPLFHRKICQPDIFVGRDRVI